MKRNGNKAASGKAARGTWFARHKILTCVLAVVLVGLVVGGYFGVRMWNAFRDPASVLSGATSTPTVEPAASSPAVTRSAGAAETPTPAPTATPEPELKTDGNAVNILVLGVAIDDYRRSIGREDKQTDCIMIVRVENLKANEKPKVTLLSVPRDTLLINLYDEKGEKITGKQEFGRVNTAYALGGLEGAKKTISHFFGDIQIDKYVLFDMQFVIDLIDEVGGVEVPVKDLSKDTVTVRAKIGTFTYKNNTTMHMDGKMALTYARDRKDIGVGDYKRGDHMQDIMKAVLDKLKDKGNLMSHAWDLYQMFSTQLITDIDDYQEIAALAGIGMRLDMESIASKKIIRYEDMHMYEGMSVFFSDPDTKKAVLKEVFGIDYTMPEEETYSEILAPIYKIINSTKRAVNTANMYLDNNTAYYTEAEAKPLKDAIKAWETARFNKDTSKLKSTEKTVKAKYDDFKALVEPRKTP